MRWFAILLLPLKGFGLLGRVIGDLLAATLYQRVKIWALGGITFKISETLSKLLRFSTPLYIMGDVLYTNTKVSEGDR